MARVTIVLPVYNGSKYLSASIRSVLSQTYGDWELIIVNDCSTDQTLEIIEEYSKRDKRIKIINNHENLKLPKSLNVGFAEASGVYFTWTSDDNLYHERAIERMVHYLDQNEQCGLVYCDMNYIDDSGNIFYTSQNMSHNLFLNNCVGACFMYRRNVASTVGMYNPQKFLVEDYDYWLRISFQYRVDRIPMILYSYRHHDENLSARREKEIMEKVCALKLEYLDNISQRLADKDYAIFCTGVLLNRPDVIHRIEKLTQERGLEYNARKKVVDRNIFDPQKRFIVFGTGLYGQRAYNVLKSENIVFFADNMQREPNFNGIEIISADKAKKLQYDFNITIAASYNATAEIIEQFETLGIDSYSIFSLIEMRIIQSKGNT